MPGRARTQQQGARVCFATSPRPTELIFNSACQQDAARGLVLPFLMLVSGAVFPGCSSLISELLFYLQPCRPAFLPAAAFLAGWGEEAAADRRDEAFASASCPQSPDTRENKGFLSVCRRSHQEPTSPSELPLRCYYYRCYRRKAKN